MVEARYISIFLLIFILDVFCISCKCDSNSENNVIESHTTIQDKPINQDQYSDYREWLKYNVKANSLSNDVLEILNESFEIFERRLVIYTNKNVDYSLDSLNEDFANDLSIGEFSIKTLEQIINIKIDNFNDNNSSRIFERISLDYPELIFAFSQESMKRINESYETIEKMDLKKKEKKRLFQQKVKDEILYTFIVECSQQKIFTHFK